MKKVYSPTILITTRTESGETVDQSEGVITITGRYQGAAIGALDHPIKALGRVAWIEAFQKGSDRCALGIRYKEIAKPHQDEILKYIIKAQIQH